MTTKATDVKTDDASTMPPFNLLAEQAVLGSVLGMPKYAGLVTGWLRPEHFWFEAHKRIYECIVIAVNAGINPDPLQVGILEMALGYYEKDGGREYLAALADTEPTAFHLEKNAERVYNCHLNWQLCKAGEKIQKIGYENLEDAHLAITAAAEQLLELAEHKRGTSARAVPDLALQASEQFAALADIPAGIRGPRFGIQKLDHKLGGLADRLLVLVEGDTSFGKSSLTRQMALRTAEALRLEGKVMLVYLLEDTSENWLNLAAAWRATVNTRKVVRAYHERATPREQERITEAFGWLMTLENLFITDDLQHISEIEADIRIRAARQPLGGILIDFVQQIEAAPASRQEQMFVHIAGRLLAIAKALKVPIILPSQISRSDLGYTYSQYCMALEKHAPVVLEITRGEPGESPVQQRRSPKVQYIIKKDRLGSVGVVTGYNELEYGQWYDDSEWSTEQQRRLEVGDCCES